MRKQRKSNIKAMLSVIGCFCVLIITVLVVVDFVRFPEAYMTINASQLRNDLNNGDEEAIEYYYENYILNDKYIFDGPTTLNLVARRYNISEDLYAVYSANNYTSVNKFIKDYVKPLVQVNELAGVNG
jgi:hypothetical protein